MKKIIIGTRGSDLALWQANYTKQLLEDKGCEVEIKIIQTTGDKTQEWNTSFDKLEGKGFFTKELEEALLKKEIHLAVHSHKDLPTVNPDGLIIAGVSKRANPSELLLIKKDAVDESQKFSLKKGAKVGTSSARRKSQLLAFRPDVKLIDLRGNVPTRIKKLRDGEYDAILLALAGTERLELDLEEFHEEVLDSGVFVPAPAQGVLAWQIHEDNDELFSLFDDITDIDVATQVRIERGVLNLMEGGCQLPLGIYVDTEFDHEDRPLFKTWVSVAKQWNEQPIQLYFQSGNSEDLPNKIMNHVTAIKPQKVFVTKDFKEHDYLPSALKRLKFEVEGKSLIEFKEVKIRVLPVTEWIFFSSKKAVQLFNEIYGKPSAKIAAIGAATAQKAIEFFGVCDFSGEDKIPEQVAKIFEEKHKPQSILFPVSNKTKDTVYNMLNESVKKEIFILYSTISLSLIKKIDKELIVFTSPSNFKSYLNQHSFLPNQKLIAFGKTTALEMKNAGIANYYVCEKNTSISLLEKIYSICTNGND